MAATTNVQIIISATDNASGVLNNVGKSLGGVNDNFAQVKKGAEVVATAFTGVVAAGVAFSGASLKMASDFQSSMLLIQTQAGASAEEVKNMTQAVLDLAPAVGQTPQQLAQGLYFIESAGLSGAKALQVLKLSAEGAAVGHEELTSVAKALTSVINSGIKGVQDFGQAMGTMDAIVGHGKMTMADLDSAISTGILPAAKQAGVSLQELGAALDVMTNNGIPAQEAATRLRMTLSLIEAPSDKAKKSLEGIGLTQRSLADDLQKGGLIAAVTDLNNHMNQTEQGSATIVKGTKMSAEQLLNLSDKILTTNDHLQKLQSEHGKTALASKTLADQIKTTQDRLNEYSGKLSGANQVINTLGGSTLDAVGKAQLLTEAFGGARSGSSIELLTQQVDKMKLALEGIDNTSNKFASSWEATQQTNAQATARLNATVQTLMIEYGNALLPVLTQVENFIANNLAPTLIAFGKFLEQHRTAAIALAAVIGGVLLFGLVAVGVVLWTSIIAPTVAFIGVAGGILIPLLVVLAGLYAVFGQPLVAQIQLIRSHLNDLGAGLKAWQTIFTDIWKNMQAIGQSFVNWFTNTFNATMKAVSGFFVSMGAAITTAFNNVIRFVVGSFAPNWRTSLGLITISMQILWDFFVIAWAAIQTLLGAVGKWIQSVFAPQIHTQYTLVQNWTTQLQQWFATQWRIITNTLTTFMNWVSKVFTSNFDAAMNVVKNILKDVNGFFHTMWDDITALLNAFGNWLAKTFDPMIDAGFAFIKKSLQELSDFWHSIWTGISSFVQGAANDIAGAIKNMLNHIIDFFNGLISGFDKVGSKLPGFVQIPQIPHFQTGGVVPGPIGQPVFAMVHGGEQINPIGGLGGSIGNGEGSGGGVSLTVNVGLYAGTETDKRNIAVALYQALLTLANSRHQTVAQMMGG